MNPAQIRSFDEFWPYYVRAHSNKGNRLLHFAGTTAAMASVAGAFLLGRPKLAALAPILGYGAAWIGHFMVEKNVPATFGHPLWSFKADFVMWSKIVNGTMDAEVERAMAEQAERGESDERDEPKAAASDGDSSRAHRPEAKRPTDRYAVN